MYRVITRGHETQDIYGIQRVVCYDTLSAIVDVVRALGKHKINLMLSGTEFLGKARKEKEVKANTIYVGGSAHMWAMLEGLIQYSAIGRECNSGYVIKREEVVLEGYKNFFVYKTTLESGRVVLALFSPSPRLTALAAVYFAHIYPDLEKYSEYLDLYAAELAEKIKPLPGELEIDTVRRREGADETRTVRWPESFELKHTIRKEKE